MPDCAEISAKEKPSASFSTTTLACSRDSARELRGQLVAELRKGRFTRRVGVARDALVLEQRLAAADALAIGHVVAGVDDQPVEPGRELRVAAELPQPDAQLGQRLLRRIAGVLGVGEQVLGQPLDPRCVPLAERGERLRVAVLRSLDEDGITEPLVDERPFAAAGLAESDGACGEEVARRP